MTGGFLAMLDVHEPAARSRCSRCSAAAWASPACSIAASRKSSDDEKLKAEAEKNAKPKEERVEDYLTVDPMEIGTRRRPDSPGRSEARRRSARTRAAGAAERGRRDRHHHAQGPHPRQHAARRTTVSHQDRRHAGRRRRGRAGTAAGDRLRRDHRPDRRHRRPRTPPSAPTPSGSIRPPRRRPRCTATRWSSRARCWRRT